MSKDKAISPFSIVRADCKKQSASDWYTMMLSASLGKKALHGCNTAPTTEVICKADSYQGLETNVGLIKWSPDVLPVPKIGDDICDGFYRHHTYRGTVTSSGSLLAFESGTWEPSTRTRAKATSLLAAGIQAHGQSSKEAVKVVSTIASDDIDEEAVASALLPASHLKREMTLVSKANHRLFSKGTLQKSIIWDDSRLSIRDHATNMAFDWGRVTAIARYIAEANIQTCPMFRQVAKHQMIPYYIVKNCWAYVTESDYFLTSDQFKNVPRIDIAKYRIPTLKGAFTNHEYEIVLAHTRHMKAGNKLASSACFDSYLKLNEDKGKRAYTGKRKRPITVESLSEVGPVEHTVTPRDAAESARETEVPWELLVGAVSSRRKAEHDLRTVIEEWDRMQENDDGKFAHLDMITQMLFQRHTWELALVGARKLEREDREKYPKKKEEEREDITQYLYKLKRDIIGYPSHIASEITFVPSILVRMREHTTQLIEASGTHAEFRFDVMADRASDKYHSGKAAFASLPDKALEILPAINSKLGDDYSYFARKVEDSTIKAKNQWFHNYMCTAYCLDSLSLLECLNKQSGYFEGCSPQKAYIYEYIRSYRRGNEWPDVRLKNTRYLHILDVAHELEGTLEHDVRVGKVCEFVISQVDLIVGDMIRGKLYEAPWEAWYKKVIDNAEKEKEVEEGEIAAASDEDEVDAAALLKIQNAFRKREKKRSKMFAGDPYDSMLDSYPTEDVVQQYAKALGFKDARQAWECYGAEMVNNLSSSFVQKALAAISQTAIRTAVVEPVVDPNAPKPYSLLTEDVRK